MTRNQMIDSIILNSRSVGLDLNPFESREIISKVLELAEEQGMVLCIDHPSVISYIPIGWEDEDET